MNFLILCDAVRKHVYNVNARIRGETKRKSFFLLFGIFLPISVAFILS